MSTRSTPEANPLRDALRVHATRFVSHQKGFGKKPQFKGANPWHA